VVGHLVQVEFKAGDDAEIARSAPQGQKSSGLSDSLTRTIFPPAVTISMEITLSAARPYFRDR
jgi:hypothetical protein